MDDDVTIVRPARQPGGGRALAHHCQPAPGAVRAHNLCAHVDRVRAMLSHVRDMARECTAQQALPGAAAHPLPDM